MYDTSKANYNATNEAELNGSLAVGFCVNILNLVPIEFIATKIECQWLATQHSMAMHCDAMREFILILHAVDTPINAIVC